MQRCRCPSPRYWAWPVRRWPGFSFAVAGKLRSLASLARTALTAVLLVCACSARYVPLLKFIGDEDGLLLACGFVVVHVVDQVVRQLAGAEGVEVDDMCTGFAHDAVGDAV